MKVYIGPYKIWTGPYQIANLLKYIGFSEEKCEKIGDWLNSTRLRHLCEFIYDKSKNRNIKIKIHDYDVWGADSTLSLIIAPTLRRLKQKKHGSPFVDDEDVPDELKSNVSPAKDINSVDGNVHARWDYVLDEMIWAFEVVEKEALDIEYWEDQFFKDGYKEKEYKAFVGRMNNGFRLFGKYYRGLWD